MTAQSQAMTRALNAARAYAGEYVVYLGVRLPCRTAEITGSKAGEQAVPVGIYGVDIASSAPRQFVFAPDTFLVRGLAQPQEGSIFTRNGLHYRVSVADFVNEGTETVAFVCNALRYIWEQPSA